MPQHFFFLLFLYLFLFFLKSNGNDSAYSPEHKCGNVSVRYPFWLLDKDNATGGRQYRGYRDFGIDCSTSAAPIFNLSNDIYLIKEISYEDHTLTLVHNDVSTNPECPRLRHNLTLGALPFNYSRLDLNLNFYFNCTSSSEILPGSRIGCLKSGENESYVSAEPQDLDWFNVCHEKVVTAVINHQREIVNVDRLGSEFGAAMNQGFVLDWQSATECNECEASDGQCGGYHNATSHQFICFCSTDGTIHKDHCRKGSELNVPRKIAIGIGAAAFGAIVMWIIFYMYHRRLKKRHSTSSMVSRDICSYPTSVADMEKAGNYYGVHVFNYDELEEATNNFDSNKELGDGGFGTVYKGKLRDGRVVAIKRLYENNYKRVEQFINEVEILALLRHKNLVTLYGCTSYRCRELLLVYEYIPNGTVADHLHGERAKPGLPSWTTRLNIAIETASALAYLHASDVIHRDVKTNNILLDDNFSVKVADFGLSRLFPANATHVSTAPQGTPGYVDPEYHQYYHLTDRSDVYSFGVVLIELISSKPAVDITRQRHEINLSNMAVNKIQSHALHELVDPYLGFESHSKVKIMITAVAKLAFQCLQLGREMRPSMQEVLEVLQGIQSNNSIIKADEMDIPADDVLLLKNDTLAYSPDSETVSRRSAIPYASG